MPNDSTLKWIFKQLMGEGISEAINRDAPVEPARPATIGPVKRSFNPEDPTAIPREWIRGKTEEYLGTPQSWLPSDLLSLISQPAGPEGANPAISLGLVPRDFARRFAAETATMIRQHPGNAVSPRTLDIVADMFERHPEIAGQVSNVGVVLDPKIQARYGRIQVYPSDRPRFDEAMQKLLRRDPTTSLPPLNQWILNRGRHLSDEDLAKTVLSQQHNSFEFNPVNLETSPIGPAGAYRSTRHEFQHLLDDLKGELPLSPPMDQAYWIDPTEIRARATENNYGRDMGPRVQASGRPFALRASQPRGKLITYPEMLSRELDTGLWEVESGLHGSYLPMPADFEDSLKKAVDFLFRGPNAKYREPAKSAVVPKYWETYFKP